MNDPLGDVEVRVLGSLIEKESITPEYCPLSLNALTNACNQSTNRHPVVQFDEQTVARAVDVLRERNLVHVIHKSDSRVTKYRQVMAETMSLDARDIAVMCVLMLRGPQTAGEIRTRSNRIYDFKNLEDVETALNSLAERNQLPLVTRLPRQAGQKEVRYAHLLCGEVEFEHHSAPIQSQAGNERVARLEAALDELRKEVDDLRKDLDRFRKQFE